MTESQPPTVFISYSWDDEAHKKWVKDLATRLRSDGIDVTLDRWAIIPGNQLPEFMERSVRENDYVLIICTPTYKVKSDYRVGGVGYEGDIMTAEALTYGNDEKYIPLLRRGEWRDAAPSWLMGKFRIDFVGDPYSEENYDELVDSLFGRHKVPPPLGKPKIGGRKTQIAKNNSSAESVVKYIYDWLGEFPRIPKITLENPKLTYYPYWIVECKLHSFFWGTVKVPRPPNLDTWKSGVRFEYKRKEAAVMRDHRYPVMASKGNEPWWNEFLYPESAWFSPKWMGAEGIFSIFKKIGSLKAERRNTYVELEFELEKNSSESVLLRSLVPNIDEQTAKKIAQESLEKLHETWGGHGFWQDPYSQHSFFYSNSTLLYVPFWEIDLKHERLTSKIVILATTGEIIYAKVPVM